MKLHEIKPKQAYEWVKTGYWNLTKFQEWHHACIMWALNVENTQDEAV